MRLLVFGACVLLAGCSDMTPAAWTCKSSIKSRNINPETVKFFDFDRMSDSKYAEALTEALGKKNFDRYSLAGSLAGGGLHMAQAVAQMTDKETKSEVEARKRALVQNKQSPYRVRYKFDDAKGSTVTAVEYCAANAKTCECVDAHL